MIEIAPLAYMRGRTLSDAFVVLDEAQNTTPEQMKMFLTRIGFGSKVVITGDVTQIDLPEDKVSEASAALAVLGYSQQEIAAALKGMDLSGLTLEQVIKQCLKRMMQ